MLGWFPEKMTSVEKLVQDMVASDMEQALAELEKKAKRGGKMPA